MSAFGRFVQVFLPLLTFYYVYNLESWFADILIADGHLTWALVYLFSRVIGCTWVAYKAATWIATGR